MSCLQRAGLERVSALASLDVHGQLVAECRLVAERRPELGPELLGLALPAEALLLAERLQLPVTQSFDLAGLRR